MTEPSETPYYDRPSVVASYQDDRAQGLTNREAHAVDAYFDSDRRLLDLGCGAGRTTRVLHDDGFDVVGLDVSKPMIGAASAADPDITYLIGDASSLPFADEQFGNVLFSYNGLDEIGSPRARVEALQEIRRVLEPGGRLAFSTLNLLRWFVPYPPTTDWLGKMARFWLRELTSGQLRSRYKSLHSGSPVHFSDPISLVRLLAALEFNILTLLGRSGYASTFLGPSLFAVVEKPTVYR